MKVGQACQSRHVTHLRVAEVERLEADEACQSRHVAHFRTVEVERLEAGEVCQSRYVAHLRIVEVERLEAGEVCQSRHVSHLRTVEVERLEARHCPLIPIDDHSCDGDVDHGEIAVDCFFETGGDSAVLFEPSDESFDDISLAVE